MQMCTTDEVQVHILYSGNTECLLFLSTLCWCFTFRHSRFGGSYVVQGLKSIGNNDVIYHRNLHDVSHEFPQLTVESYGSFKNNVLFLFFCFS